MHNVITNNLRRSDSEKMSISFLLAPAYTINVQLRSFSILKINKSITIHINWYLLTKSIKSWINSLINLMKLSLSPTNRAHLVHWYRAFLTSRKMKTFDINKLCLFVQTNFTQRLYLPSETFLNFLWPLRCL